MKASKQPRHIRQYSVEDEKYQAAMEMLKRAEEKDRQEKDLLKMYRRRKRLERGRKIRTILKFCILFIILMAIVVAGLVLASPSFRTFLSQKTGLNFNVFQSASSKTNFKPALPQNSQQKVTITQNNQNKIASYQDTFAGSTLVISQQELPASFKSDPQAIPKLDQFKSAAVIDTSKGKLYVATNLTGQQWAAISFGNVLVFINSSKTLNDSSWRDYISKLQFK